MRMYIIIMAFAIGNALGFNTVKIGTYHNTNSQTKNITKVRITKDAKTGQEFIRIYASCGKGECYWGRFKINEYKGYDYLERKRRLPDGATWFGSYKSFIIDQGFVKRKVRLAKNLRHDDHIRITIESDYKDPLRQHRTDRNILKLR